MSEIKHDDEWCSWKMYEETNQALELCKKTGTEVAHEVWKERIRGDELQEALDKAVEAMKFAMNGHNKEYPLCHSCLNQFTVTLESIKAVRK